MTKFILAVVIGAFIVLYFLYKQEKPFGFKNNEAGEDEDDDFGRPQKPDVV
jgi:hypothetical protein